MDCGLSVRARKVGSLELMTWDFAAYLRARLLRCGLLCFDVVAEQDVLVADVELAAADDGVGPALFSGAVRLFEAACFLVGFRIDFDECDDAGVVFPATFAAQIQHAVGDCQCTFSNGAILPLHFSSLHLHARPTAFITVPIHKVADARDSAVMIDHVGVGVNLLG